MVRIASILVGLAVVSGALLSSEAAGLAIPYWPCSLEAWTQKPIDGAFWSYVHRLAGLSLLLLLGCRGSARWVLWGLIAFAVVSGAYGVKWALPTWAVVAHALSAHLLAAGVVMLFVKAFKFTDSPKRELLFWVWVTPMLIVVQIVLGALLRHMPVYRVTGYVKAVYGLPWLVLIHVLVGLLVISVVCWTASLCYRRDEHTSYSKLAIGTIFCIAFQFILGLGAYVFRLLSRADLQPSVLLVTATLLHVVGGALTLSVQTALALKVTFPSTMEMGERIATRGDEH